MEGIHRLLVFLRTGFRINKQREGQVNLKLVTIFRKVVNSFKTIALIENRYIVYMNIRQHV